MERNRFAWLHKSALQGLPPDRLRHKTASKTERNAAKKSQHERELAGGATRRTLRHFGYTCSIGRQLGPAEKEDKSYRSRVG